MNSILRNPIAIILLVCSVFTFSGSTFAQIGELTAKEKRIANEMMLVAGITNAKDRLKLIEDVQLVNSREIVRINNCTTNAEGNVTVFEVDFDNPAFSDLDIHVTPSAGATTQIQRIKDKLNDPAVDCEVIVNFCPQTVTRDESGNVTGSSPPTFKGFTETPGKPTFVDVLIALIHVFFLTN